METATVEHLSFGRLALHYTKRPFSKAQSQVLKVTRSALSAQKEKVRSKSVSAATASGQLDHFHLFPALPQELRLQIWQLTLPRRRVIQIQEGRPKQGRLVKRQLILPWVSRILVPVLLHVCAESRAEGLRYYQLAFGKPGVHPPHIYVDFARDIIYFGRRDYGDTLISAIGTIDSQSLISADFLSSPSFKDVRRLAVNPKGVLSMVEWEWRILRESQLQEIWVLNQMTQGRSFRLGRAPSLEIFKHGEDELLENVGEAIAWRTMGKAQTRLEQRNEGADKEGGKLRILPQLRTCQFVYADGDSWVGSARPLKGAAQVPNFFVV